MGEPQNLFWIRLRLSGVSILCLLGAVWGSVQLYQNFNEVSILGKGDPLGFIERQEASVRKKPAQLFVWKKATHKEPLFLKDSIQTGSESAANIRLQDGTSIDMGENSLIVIDHQDQLPLAYAKGSVILRQKTGDQKITIAANGKLQIELLTVRLLSPPSLYEAFIQEEGTSPAPPIPLVFSWDGSSHQKESLETQKHWTLAISTDPQFKKNKTQHYPIENPLQKKLTLSFSLGKYYWRLLDQNKKTLTETRPFLISKPPVKELASSLPEAKKPLLLPAPSEGVSPAPGSVITLSTFNTPLSLSWKPVPEAKAYEVQLFEAILPSQKTGPSKNWKERDRQQVQSAFISFKNLPVGSYAWCVRSLSGENLTSHPENERPLPSPLFEFELRYPPLLGAPHLKTQEVQ